MDALRGRLLPPLALAVIGLSAFVIGAAGLSAVHLNASLDQIEQWAAESNAGLGKSITSFLATDIARLLAEARKASPEERGDDWETGQLMQSVGQAVADRLVMHPNIFKFAIIAPSGRTVFATDGAQIGADKSAEDGFRAAMTGRTGTSITFQKRIDTPGAAEPGRDVVVSYLPLKTTAAAVAAGRPVTTVSGVYEIQADVTTRKARVQQTLLWELGVMLASFAVIFILLLLIVRVSNRRLINNYRQQNRLSHNVTRVEEADRAKTVFLSDISHKMRTRLNSIIGFSEILKEETFGPLGSQQYQSYATDIHQSGQHLLAIIADILELSSIQSGQAELHEEALSLSECLESTAAKMSRQPDAIALAFHLELEPNLPQLLANLRAIQHILQNLLSNAIKYTLVGSITVTARVRRDQTLEFSIADTGIGMPENDLKQLDQRLTQIETSWERRFQGTDLGLALVKTLMTQHGGDVSIISEVGVGTTITCHFPRHRTVIPTAVADRAQS